MPCQQVFPAGAEYVQACVKVRMGSENGGTVYSEDKLFKDKIGEIETAGVGRGCETVGGINAVCPFSAVCLESNKWPQFKNDSCF